MLSLGLTTAQRNLYHQRLASSYAMRVSIVMTDLDHKTISDLSALLIDGNIKGKSVKGGGDSVGVERSANLTLFDPTRTLELDSASPNKGAIYADRMIKVAVSVYVAELATWVTCPVFCGPVTKLERDGVVIQLTALDKAHLLVCSSNTAREYEGKKTTIVRNIAKDFGESTYRINVPDLPTKAIKPVTMVRETEPWAKLYNLTRSLGRTAYYDARGVLKMRRTSTAPVLVMDGGWLLSIPQIGYDTSNLRNVVRVWGKGALGEKHNIDETVYLPSWNPNSRQRLGRGGKVRPLLHSENPNDLRNTTEAKTLAKRLLADLGSTVVDTTFDARPLWSIEVGDLLRVNTPYLNGSVRVNHFSLPLRCDGVMSIGYTRPVLNTSRALIRRP